MERTKYILIVVLGFIAAQVFGQINKPIYQAYISGNMEAWRKLMDAYKPQSNAQRLELVNYQYGYIAYCIDQDKDEEAERYLMLAKDVVDDLQKQNYELSTLYAYKAAFVGFSIGLAPYMAPFIGSESISNAEKSVSIDSLNYFGYTQLGHITYYTPYIFGGSETEAMMYYLKALQLMEEDTAVLKNNWNYLNLLATLIRAYDEQEQYELAKQYCIKALRFEPDFEWVENMLYPETLKLMDND